MTVPPLCRREDSPESVPRLQSLFVLFEIKEEDEKLHALFGDNKDKLFEATEASQTVLNGRGAL